MFPWPGCYFLTFFSQWVGEGVNVVALFLKYCIIVPPCGHVRHCTVQYMTGLMNDQDGSVLFHCVSMNFAPMSTFLKATVVNK